MLEARLGRLERARRQWEILSATCTHPDPEVVALLDETRSALQAAEAMQRATRK